MVECCCRLVKRLQPRGDVNGPAAAAVAGRRSRRWAAVGELLLLLPLLLLLVLLQALVEQFVMLCMGGWRRSTVHGRRRRSWC